MYKSLYLPYQGKNVPVVIRNYTERDFEELIRIQQESFPPPFSPDLWWNEEQLRQHVTLFPEGAVCVEVDGTLAGSMTSLIVDFDPDHIEHTWAEITDNGYIGNHNPKGNSLYVVDLCVRPAWRGLDLGRWMMQSMYELVVHKGLLRLIGGARMPGYHRWADRLSPEEYVAQVVAGTLKDPVVSFLLRCGRVPLGVVANYLEDEESLNHAVLMEWANPFLVQENRGKKA
jgi:ribosomal protein S18 acetylase RimI-like enzyme